MARAGAGMRPGRARQGQEAQDGEDGGERGPQRSARDTFPQGPLPFGWIGRGAADPGHAIPGRGEEETGGGDDPEDALATRWVGEWRRDRHRRSIPSARGGPSARRVLISPAYVRPPGPTGFRPPSAGRVRRGKLAHRPGAEPVAGGYAVRHRRRLLRRERQRHAGRDGAGARAGRGSEPGRPLRAQRESAPGGP